MWSGSIIGGGTPKYNQSDSARTKAYTTGTCAGGSFVRGPCHEEMGGWKDFMGWHLV